jgi:hypothetical protein
MLQLLLSGLSLFVLFNVYQYLNDIESCPCFMEENYASKYQTNISFMKFYQLLEIFSLIIFVILISFYKYDSRTGGKKALKASRMSKYIIFIIVSTILTLGILMGISGYMGYNSFALYKNMKKECICANKWQRYFVYLQGVSNSIYFLRIVYTILFIMLLIVFNYLF